VNVIFSVSLLGGERCLVDASVSGNGSGDFGSTVVPVMMMVVVANRRLATHGVHTQISFISSTLRASFASFFFDGFPLSFSL